MHRAAGPSSASRFPLPAPRCAFRHNRFVIARTAVSLALYSTLTLASASQRIAWSDVAPIRQHLEAHGIRTPAAFSAYIARVSRENAARVRQGDFDHLVFYLLQSTRFTRLRPVEPALSARDFVESLTPRERAEFLDNGRASRALAPPLVRDRARDLLEALESPGGDLRLQYFRVLVRDTLPTQHDRHAALMREYVRVMRFVYLKEFVAQRGTDQVAALYRSRGFATDTAVEAGYLVYLGLGAVKGVDPDRRVHRVLIIGPGLDLAPRTGLREETPPESYQPWAVLDALLALRLATLDDLHLTAADINPRVLAHLQRVHGKAPLLTLETEIETDERVTLSDEYRDYFAGLGNAIGRTEKHPDRQAKALRKRVQVSDAAARAVHSMWLDIVTERLRDTSFDLVIATNIFPYFDDAQLALALSNIASMLAPGGVLLHNEPRPVIGDISSALGMPFERSRHATLAKVRGADAPLFDSVWVHRKK